MATHISHVRTAVSCLATAQNDDNPNEYRLLTGFGQFVRETTLHKPFPHAQHILYPVVEPKVNVFGELGGKVVKLFFINGRKHVLALCEPIERNEKYDHYVAFVHEELLKKGGVVPSFMVVPIVQSGERHIILQKEDDDSDLLSLVHDGEWKSVSIEVEEDEKTGVRLACHTRRTVNLNQKHVWWIGPIDDNCHAYSDWPMGEEHAPKTVRVVSSGQPLVDRVLELNGQCGVSAFATARKGTETAVGYADGLLHLFINVGEAPTVPVGSIRFSQAITAIQFADDAKLSLADVIVATANTVFIVGLQGKQVNGFLSLGLEVRMKIEIPFDQDSSRVTTIASLFTDEPVLVVGREDGCLMAYSLDESVQAYKNQPSGVIEPFTLRIKNFVPIRAKGPVEYYPGFALLEDGGFVYWNTLLEQTWRERSAKNVKRKMWTSEGFRWMHGSVQDLLTTAVAYNEHKFQVAIARLDNSGLLNAKGEARTMFSKVFSARSNIDAAYMHSERAAVMSGNSFLWFDIFSILSGLAVGYKIRLKAKDFDAPSLQVTAFTSTDLPFHRVFVVGTTSGHLFIIDEHVLKLKSWPSVDDAFKDEESFVVHSFWQLGAAIRDVRAVDESQVLVLSDNGVFRSFTRNIIQREWYSDVNFLGCVRFTTGNTIAFTRPFEAVGVIRWAGADGKTLIVSDANLTMNVHALASLRSAGDRPLKANDAEAFVHIVMISPSERQFFVTDSKRFYVARMSEYGSIGYGISPHDDNMIGCCPILFDAGCRGILSVQGTADFAAFHGFSSHGSLIDRKLLPLRTGVETVDEVDTYVCKCIALSTSAVDDRVLLVGCDRGTLKLLSFHNPDALTALYSPDFSYDVVHVQPFNDPTVSIVKITCVRRRVQLAEGAHDVFLLNSKGDIVHLIVVQQGLQQGAGYVVYEMGRQSMGNASFFLPIIVHVLGKDLIQFLFIHKEGVLQMAIYDSLVKENSELKWPSLGTVTAVVSRSERNNYIESVRGMQKHEFIFVGSSKGDMGCFILHRPSENVAFVPTKAVDLEVKCGSAVKAINFHEWEDRFSVVNVKESKKRMSYPARPILAWLCEDGRVHVASYLFTPCAHKPLQFSYLLCVSSPGMQGQFLTPILPYDEMLKKCSSGLLFGIFGRQSSSVVVVCEKKLHDAMSTSQCIPSLKCNHPSCRTANSVVSNSFADYVLD